MKRLLCALMVFFSVNCVASQHIDVDKGNMTDQQVAEIKLRRASERELQLFMIDPDNYEPMVEFHPRSCYWDWC